jgi:diguanylate cyclase
VRWNHPAHGDIAPITIVKIAERSDLISEIGTWVLERACQDHRKLTQRFPGLRLDLTVNVSARQIASTNLTSTVKNILDINDLDPTMLVLELTETIVVDDTARSIATLTGLAKLEIRLALDDFGSGYSSLHYLDRLPIDIIKIDQHFISRLTDDCADTTIISGVTDIAHQLGIAVIAEGIVTRTQHDHINAIGCDYAQGHYYARPMTASVLGSHLEAHMVDRHQLRRRIGRAVCQPEARPQ